MDSAALQKEVLEAALNLTPSGFEQLVVELLEAMGYGRLGSVEKTHDSGDDGIDGIISQDPLGLDRIYVQAKRYAENAVGRPKIQEFAGALQSRQGDRGVFITTSRFTADAVSSVEALRARIELIDGPRLADLMIKYEVGAQPEEKVTLYRLDEDYFENL